MGGREREGGMEGEGEREGEGGRDRGREGGRKGGREGGREGEELTFRAASFPQPASEMNVYVCELYVCMHVIIL
jgi:hypothetical protein